MQALCDVVELYIFYPLYVSKNIKNKRLTFVLVCGLEKDKHSWSCGFNTLSGICTTLYCTI